VVVMIKTETVKELKRAFAARKAEWAADEAEQGAEGAAPVCYIGYWRDGAWKGRPRVRTFTTEAAAQRWRWEEACQRLGVESSNVANPEALADAFFQRDGENQFVIYVCPLEQAKRRPRSKARARKRPSKVAA
jgi:hypothetical protein